MADRGALPTFVIVGVSKSGTTTMFDVLARHPDVCPSSTKETRYFQPIRYGEPLPPLEAYRAFFRSCSEARVVMECTPDYIYGAAATARVVDETCRPRVAIVLREPVARLVSFFRFQRARLQLPAEMSLADYVAACRVLPDEVMNDREQNRFTGLWGGRYDRFLPAWLDRYGERCLVTFFDDLVADPPRFFADVCRWIDVDPAALPDVADRRENATVAYRSPRVQLASARLAKLARPVLSRHPRLAGRVRGAYQAVNERPAQDEDVAADLQAELTAYYADSVTAVRAQLTAAGITGLPAWLRPA